MCRKETAEHYVPYKYHFYKQQTVNYYNSQKCDSCGSSCDCPIQHYMQNTANKKTDY